MDACISPLRYEGFCAVQTVDLFYPLVDDPYIQGI